MNTHIANTPCSIEHFHSNTFIAFDSKPDDNIRASLKKQGFYWDPCTMLWVKPREDGAPRRARWTTTKKSKATTTKPTPKKRSSLSEAAAVVDSLRETRVDMSLSDAEKLLATLN